MLNIKNKHDGLYFIDRDRVITYWNKAAERISGFTADEVVGKSCADNIDVSARLLHSLWRDH
ncbi:PAS domain-containing protein [Verrucomicrobiota bacterium]